MLQSEKGTTENSRLGSRIVEAAANTELVAEVLVVLQKWKRQYLYFDSSERPTRFPSQIGASVLGESEQKDPAPMRLVPHSHWKLRRLKSSTRLCSPWQATEQAAHTAESFRQVRQA